MICAYDKCNETLEKGKSRRLFCCAKCREDNSNDKRPNKKADTKLPEKYLVRGLK